MKLEEMEELCEKATRGRWVYYSDSNSIKAIDIDNGHWVMQHITSDFYDDEANAKFIVMARNKMDKFCKLLRAVDEYLVRRKHYEGSESDGSLMMLAQALGKLKQAREEIEKD